MDGFCLTEQEVEQLSQKIPTPFLVVSLKQVEANYNLLRQNLSRAGVYYSIKANPNPDVIKHLAKLGSNFDAASWGEIELLQNCGVAADRIIYANTVKIGHELKKAYKIGVRRLTFDDISEIDKMAECAPGADVLLRISVPNDQAVFDLNTKFGTSTEQAIPLLRSAKSAGLNPIGICFHVGSQSLSERAYVQSLALCRRLFDKAGRFGLNLTDLDIGGGLPVPSADASALDVARMMRLINDAIDKYFPNTKVWCEPGRYMCGTAVNLVASIIGTKERGITRWYILDEGIYGAFSGIMYDHWTYPLHLFGTGETTPAVFAGPSCDGIDVLYRDVMAPRLYIGDKILVSNIGAYSTVSATKFNGFPLAPTIVYEDYIK